MEHDIASTRQQIIQLMRERGKMTARDIARELGITSVGVRRHLANLEKDGLASVQLVRQKVGRPTFIYSLTDQAQELFPKNYHSLATQLLDAIQVREGDKGIDSIFSARMDQLLSQYRPRMEGKDLQGRVRELAKIQDEAGYMALWESAPDGYILKEQNCAIYRVACRFQQACHFEIELFRRLLDAEVTRIEHQVKGERYCTYLIRQKPTRSSRSR